MASLITNFPGTFFWMLNEQLFDMLDKPTVLMSEIFIVTIYLLPIAFIADGATVDASDTGIFGFLHHNNVWLGFFWNAAVAGFWGYSGFILCLEYFSPLVVMNCLLLEPLIGQCLGQALNIDEAPGPMTWIGVALIGIAINVIHQGSERRKTAAHREIVSQT